MKWGIFGLSYVFHVFCSMLVTRVMFGFIDMLNNEKKNDRKGNHSEFQRHFQVGCPFWYLVFVS